MLIFMFIYSNVSQLLREIFKQDMIDCCLTSIEQYFSYIQEGPCGLIKSATFTTEVASSNPVHGEVYSKQQYVIKFVSDLQQVSGFLQVLQFPPTIKLTATI
jgi:hypothetical protein